MSVEGRGWVTRVGVDLVNWQQEEPAGLGGRRQPSGGGTSRMSRGSNPDLREARGVTPRAYSATANFRQTAQEIHVSPRVGEERPVDRWRIVVVLHTAGCCCFPAGAARRNCPSGRTARSSQGRACFWRGEANP